MDLVLVRHAQPEWARDGISQVDPELTELGERQAELVAERLAGEHFDHVLVSTSRRAQATARPVRQRLHDIPTTDRVWLHEIYLPQAWADTPNEEVGRVLLEARDRPRDEWWDGLPGGESFRDFHERVTTGLMQELAGFGATRKPDGLWEVADEDLRLLLVAHAGTNSLVLGALLGLEPEPWEWERFASDHASVTLLRTTAIAGGHIFGLQRFSDVEHLPDDHVSA
jgi:broad specificity phosphatase PhoE